MKTAISIADALFQEGERAAEAMKLSRSQLYAKALAEYLRHHSNDEITRKLNEVYADGESDLDPVLHDMAMRTLRREPW